MRILLHCPAFLPRVGGLEINVATLAQSYAEAGHQVIVWTTTPDPTSAAATQVRAFRIVRRPSPWQALRLVRWSDVFVHENLSLHGVWPLLLVHRPWVVSHHSWYCRSDGRIAWQDRLKRWIVRYADASIAVSRGMAADLATPSEVIPNAYRDRLFRLRPEIPRDRELVFVGRLVSDKGVDLLLESLAQLARREIRPGLTVVGDGPDRQMLERLAADLGLAERVDFLGTRTGEELVRTLNRHQVLVVPSRYNEPFGIVALEGIACGCFVIGTAGGGLPEAIGPCGTVVPNQDPPALADAIAAALADDDALHRAQSAAAGHLASHTVADTSARYLRIFVRVAAEDGARG